MTTCIERPNAFLIPLVDIAKATDIFTHDLLQHLNTRGAVRVASMHYIWDFQG